MSVSLCLCLSASLPLGLQAPALPPRLPQSSSHPIQLHRLGGSERREVPVPEGSPGPSRSTGVGASALPPSLSSPLRPDGSGVCTPRPPPAWGPPAQPLHRPLLPLQRACHSIPSSTSQPCSTPSLPAPSQPSSIRAARVPHHPRAPQHHPLPQTALAKATRGALTAECGMSGAGSLLLRAERPWRGGLGPWTGSPPASDPCHLPGSMWLWKNYVTSLSLSFPVCEMG